MKKLLAGLLAAVLLTAPAFGDDTVWDSLEGRYYEDISQTETDITLRFLEEGDQLDWSRAVRRYHMEDSLLTRSGVDAFLTAVRSGELLSSRISYDERLMVFVEQADGSGGTAVVLISSMTTVPVSSVKMPSARPSRVKVMSSACRSTERNTSA